MKAADQSPHYVRSVTETGERNEVVAHEDIYAANGVKLLARGARVNRGMLERLTGHKLKAPLDLSLSAADTVNPVAIAREIDHLLASDGLLRAIVNRSGEPQGWKALLGRLVLPPPLAFRLTVMRDDRPDLFSHSLRVAVVACCIGIRLGLGDETCGHVLLAALCHDIGEMHTDPEILQPGRRVQSAERRFIHVHPLTGYVVLQQMNDVPGEVMRGVLEHHERLDGSGYPHALGGDRVGEIARVLSVAEVKEAVLARHGLLHLDVVLRLNQSRLDRRCMGALRDLLPFERELQDEDRPRTDLAVAAGGMHAVLAAWEPLRAQINADDRLRDLRFVGKRMAMLQSLSLQAGLEPTLLTLLDLDGEDAPVLREVATTLQEFDRLLTEIGDEINRRIPDGSPCREHADRILALLRNRNPERHA